MLFRQSIYDTSPKFVFDNKAELDEAMFKGHKKGKCDRELQEKHSSLVYILEMGKFVHLSCLTESKKKNTQTNN